MMDDVIYWKTLSDSDKNKIIHSKIMDQPLTCSGHMVMTRQSPMMLYRCHCSTSIMGALPKDKTHPIGYVIDYKDIDNAWLVLHRMLTKTDEKTKQHFEYYLSMLIEDDKAAMIDGYISIQALLNLKADDINIAALRAKGYQVITEERCNEVR